MCNTCRGESGANDVHKCKKCAKSTCQECRAIHADGVYCDACNPDRCNACGNKFADSDESKRNDIKCQDQGCRVNSVCSSCAKLYNKCDTCNGKFCKKHAIKVCSGCNKNWCSLCSLLPSTCDQCFKPMCDGCQEGGKCSTCRGNRTEAIDNDEPERLAESAGGTKRKAVEGAEAVQHPPSKKHKSGDEHVDAGDSDSDGDLTGDGSVDVSVIDSGSNPGSNSNSNSGSGSGSGSESDCDEATAAEAVKEKVTTYHVATSSSKTTSCSTMVEHVRSKSFVPDATYYFFVEKRKLTKNDTYICSHDYAVPMRIEKHPLTERCHYVVSSWAGGERAKVVFGTLIDLYIYVLVGSDKTSITAIPQAGEGKYYKITQVCDERGVFFQCDRTIPRFDPTKYLLPVFDKHILSLANAKKDARISTLYASCNSIAVIESDDGSGTLSPRTKSGKRKKPVRNQKTGSRTSLDIESEHDGGGDSGPERCARGDTEEDDAEHGGDESDCEDTPEIYDTRKRPKPTARTPVRGRATARREKFEKGEKTGRARSTTPQPLHTKQKKLTVHDSERGPGALPTPAHAQTENHPPPQGAESSKKIRIVIKPSSGMTHAHTRTCSVHFFPDKKPLFFPPPSFETMLLFHIYFRAKISARSKLYANFIFI